MRTIFNIFALFKSNISGFSVCIMETAIRLPNDYEDLSSPVMRNLDYEVDFDVARKLKEGKYFASYTAWDFIGYVWWDKDLHKWHCEVWKRKKYQETKTAGELEELMLGLSAKYGER